MKQLALSDAERNLSALHGGITVCGKFYCRLYRFRPQHIDERWLCTGGNGWDQCPDYYRCEKNRPKPPAPLVVLMAQFKNVDG